MTSTCSGLRRLRCWTRGIPTAAGKFGGAETDRNDQDRKDVPKFGQEIGHFNQHHLGAGHLNGDILLIWGGALRPRLATRRSDFVDLRSKLCRTRETK